MAIYSFAPYFFYTLIASEFLLGMAQSAQGSLNIDIRTVSYEQLNSIRPVVICCPIYELIAPLMELSNNFFIVNVMKLRKKNVLNSI